MKKILAFVTVIVAFIALSQSFAQSWTNYPPPTNSWWTNPPPPPPTNYNYTNFPPFTNFPPVLTNLPPFTNFPALTNFPSCTNLPPVWTNVPPVCTNLPPGLTPSTNGAPGNIQTILQQFKTQRAALIAELQAATDASQRAAVLQQLAALRQQLQQELQGIIQTAKDQAKQMQTQFANPPPPINAASGGSSGTGRPRVTH